MMGLAYLGGGGPSSSSSSSSLSALAPPFTVDRSNSKSTTSPLLQFSDTAYATSFGLNWQYANSAAPGPNMHKKSELDVDSTKVTSIASVNDYGFRLSTSQSNVPQNRNWSTLSPNAENTTHSFLYDCKVEPYYPSYVSPVVNEDIPLVSPNKPSYDILPSPGLVSANVSSQVDYTQNLSGLEYTPQWAYDWNGLVDAKRGKLAEIDGSFPLDNTIAADTSAYKHYVNQGLNMAECGNILGNSGIPCGEFSDAIGRESNNHLVKMEHSENMSLLPQKVLSLPFDSSRTTISSSSLTIPEPLPPGLSLQSSKNFMGFQAPYNLYDKCSHPVDSCVSSPASASKLSPAAPVSTGSVPQGAASGDTFGILNVSSVYQNGHNDLPKSKEPEVFLNSKGEDASQLKSHRDGSDTMSSLSSSVVEEPSSKPQAKDILTQGLRMKSGSQAPSISVSDGLLSSADSVQLIKSSENFSDGLDHHNPAVDSPCWKGAPASHWSLFDALESETAPHFLNKSDECCHLDLQVDRTLCPLNDPIRSPSKEPGEDKGQLGFGSTAREQRFSNAAKATLNSPTLTSRKVVPFYGDPSKNGEHYCLPNHSNRDSLSKFSGKKQLSDEEDNIAAAQPKLQAAVLDTVINSADTTEGGDVAVRAAENVLCSPTSEESAAEQGKQCRSESIPTMHVKTLINAMQNLSELLLFNYSTDSCALKEQDRESIKHVISNLGALVSEKMVFVTQSQDPIVPQPDISDKVGVSMDTPMSIAAGKGPFLNRDSAKSHGQVDYWQPLEEKGNQNGSGDTAQFFEKSSLLRDGLDVLGDDKMARGIRKVLNENFHFGEEMQSEGLLFKKLWLDAEAKLCSVSYRARFDRMKTEMEKFKSNQAKDASENAAASGKSSVSNNLHDLNTIILEQPNAEAGSGPKTAIPTSPSYPEDVEASVMCRLHILKCRDDPKASNLVGQLAADDVESSAMTKLNILKCPDDMKVSNLVRQRAVDDVESSTTTRHNILKCRNDPEPMNAVVQGAADGVESSIMTSHHILKFCSDPKPMNSAGRLADMTDAAYAGRMPSIGGQRVDLGGTGYESVKDFLLSATDDSVTQTSGNSGQRNQNSIGSNDNSSSDWEHIIKDDVLWR